MILNGYIDASGKEETASDRILSVNGLLSTPDNWREFDRVWQAFLKAEGFKRHRRTHKYVFHTSGFWTGKDVLMPQGLSEQTKRSIYRQLITIIRDHTLYNFGYGVRLDEYRDLELEFPNAIEAFLKKAGTRMSYLCFRHNTDWAISEGFPSVSYVFDRGDAFFRELLLEYARTRDRVTTMNGEFELAISSLEQGDSADLSALQAADILAWECRRYFLTLPSDVEQRGFLDPPGHELSVLAVPGKSHLVLYGRDDLKAEIREAGEGLLPDEYREVLIGPDKPFQNIDEFMKYLFEMDRTTPR